MNEGHFHCCHRVVRYSAKGPGRGIAKAHVRYVLRTSANEGLTRAELKLPDGTVITDAAAIRAAMNSLIDNRINKAKSFAGADGKLRIVEKVSLALPNAHALSAEQAATIARNFVSDLTRSGQAPALWAMHDEAGTKNRHVHCVFIDEFETRERAAERCALEGGKRVRRQQVLKFGDLYRDGLRGLKTKTWIRIRAQVRINEALRLAGKQERVNAGSYARRKVDKVAGRHLGPEAISRQARSILQPIERVVSHNLRKVNQSLFEDETRKDGIPELEALAASFHQIALGIVSASKARTTASSFKTEHTSAFMPATDELDRLAMLFGIFGTRQRAQAKLKHDELCR